MTSMKIRRSASAGLVALLLLGVSGCFNPFDPRIAPTTGVYIPPPTPSSPQNVVRLFAWCWNNRDITVYQEIFTADYRFVFALADSAGEIFRDKPVNREMELTMARNLFVGGGSASPATNITLTLAPTLIATPDSRTGKNGKWHKEIVTSVDLGIKTEEGVEYRIVGDARFFVVRGDSAMIPDEMQLAGFRSDSTRWYIEQWNDETMKDAAAMAPGPAGTEQLRAALPFGRVTASAAGSVVRRPAAPAATTDQPFDMSWGKLHALYAY
jgi:hypothetical protein